MTIKKVTIFALMMGSLTVTNLATADESTLMNDDHKIASTALHDSSVKQNFDAQTNSEHNDVYNYALPVKGWTSKFRHHRSDRSHNNIRFRGGFNGHRGKHFRFDHGYSHNHGNFSRYGKGYTYRYRGHSKFKGNRFKGRSIRRHRNHW